MKLRESKNLKVDLIPWTRIYDGYERFDPKFCIFESFLYSDDKITLFFKNDSQTIIKAINADGGREIDILEKKLLEWKNLSYEEILDKDF